MFCESAVGVRCGLAMDSPTTFYSSLCSQTLAIDGKEEALAILQTWQVTRVCSRQTKTPTRWQCIGRRRGPDVLTAFSVSRTTWKGSRLFGRRDMKRRLLLLSGSSGTGSVGLLLLLTGSTGRWTPHSAGSRSNLRGLRRVTSCLPGLPRGTTLGADAEPRTTKGHAHHIGSLYSH